MGTGSQGTVGDTAQRYRADEAASSAIKLPLGVDLDLITGPSWNSLVVASRAAPARKLVTSAHLVGDV